MSPFRSRRESVVPTTRGVVVCVTGAVLYGLAWVSQIGWFYIADALVWGLLLVNVPLPWLNLRGLSAQRGMGAHKTYDGAKQTDIFEEDVVGLAIRIHNRSLFPGFLITLEEHCPSAAPDEKALVPFIGSTAPRSIVTVEYHIRCYQRGIHIFPPLKVETSAPFGLFRALRTIRAPLEVMVYPQVLPMDTTSAQGALLGQLAESNLLWPSGELRGSREYQPGDQARNIHWRNSARRGRLMVKEFDEVPRGDVCLTFNPGWVHGESRDNTLEYSVKIAASLAHWCFQGGRPFRMWPPGDEPKLSTWHAVLEYLARVDTTTEATARPRPHGGGLA